MEGRFNKDIHKKFDPDVSDVGNAGDMEKDIAEEKEKKSSEVAADLKFARQALEEAGKEQAEWKAKLEEAKKKEAESLAKARTDLAAISSGEIDNALDNLEEPEDITGEVEKLAA